MYNITYVIILSIISVAFLIELLYSIEEKRFKKEYPFMIILFLMMCLFTYFSFTGEDVEKPYVPEINVTEYEGDNATP